MPEWLPFFALFVCGVAGIALLLYALHMEHEDWAEEREATTHLRLIHGEGAEVRDLRRSV